MDSDETRKLVRFPAMTGEAVCGACGSPRQAGLFCRSCAFGLVDLAVTLDPEQTPGGFVEAGRENGLQPRTVPLCYGHYEVCRSSSGGPWELGRGSMGITYKALDTHLGRHAALKVINARHLTGAGARDRFLHEARTAAQLRHPNIASVFHLGPEAEDCFYAMEFIEGETLEARVQRGGALPCRLALNVVLQAARALQAAHARQFIHRDIKPANIMLMDGGHDPEAGVTVKLIDFGLVKTVTEEMPRGGWCQGYFAGTPHYASPEQLEDGTVDARSDIYSLGRCLEYMLLGLCPGEAVAELGPERTPFQSTSAASNPTPKIPGEVAALLASMTAAAPSARPPCADDLVLRVTECLAAVEAAGKHVPTEDESSTFFNRRGNKRKQRWFVALVGLLGLAAVIVAARQFFPQRDSLNPSQAAATLPVLAESRALAAQGKEHFRKHTPADNQLAIKAYSDAITLSPSNAEARAALASVYYENVGRFGAPKEQLDLAVESAERAAAIDPNLPEAFQALGAIRNLQGQPWESLLQLHRALELNPEFVQAMSDFSLVWNCVGHPEMALPWANAAARLEPSKVQGWHAAAEASVELCMDEQAEQYYQRCLELRPIWMSGHCGLIHLHLLQGDFARARQDLARAESTQAGSICPLTLAAQVALFSGEYVQAENIYRQLVARKKDGYVRYYSAISYLSALGFLRLQAGDEPEARSFLAEAESLHSANSEGPEDVYDLAAIRAIQGREEDALTLLNQAISSGWNDYRATRLDPRFSRLRDNPRFQQMLDGLSIRTAAKRNRAEQLCQRPLDLADYPVNPTVQADGR